MSGFFTALGAAVAIILVLCVLFASVTSGFKAMFLGIVNKIREGLPKDNGQTLRQAGDKLFNMGQQQPESLMKEIVITTGKCQCCGRTYIGTTDDSDCPLKAVEFMGTSKVLCQDCLNQLMSEFQRSGVSQEKKFSSSAEGLRDLLSNIGNKN
ncbi:MAG: hypothetical protein HDR50_11990 [Desulfovibrio sp.]|uniref:hypothetical protein n=1 Tax=Desulfovibrio sp. TaxID=885 RepID=UPI001A7C707B|nr:hypothetical protein [Desulfovibrio sp.]MBD5418332.1 hypothetical protein [Desulfovibrio sp.]